MRAGSGEKFFRRFTRVPIGLVGWLFNRREPPILPPLARRADRVGGLNNFLPGGRSKFACRVSGLAGSPPPSNMWEWRQNYSPISKFWSAVVRLLKGNTIFLAHACSRASRTIDFLKEFRHLDPDTIKFLKESHDSRLQSTKNLWFLAGIQASGPRNHQIPWVIPRSCVPEWFPWGVHNTSWPRNQANDFRNSMILGIGASVSIEFLKEIRHLDLETIGFLYELT